MPYDAGRLVVGCGNVLFKDDGFGPMVIHALEDYFKENDMEMPEDTQFIDAGTGATHFIFSMPDDNWKKVIVVDVVEWNAEPGTLKKFSPYDMPKGKYENAHTWPVEEPLHDLVDGCGFRGKSDCLQTALDGRNCTGHRRGFVGIPVH